jgi:hypothetical protein
VILVDGVVELITVTESGPQLIGGTENTISGLLFKTIDLERLSLHPAFVVSINLIVKRAVSFD